MPRLSVSVRVNKRTKLPPADLSDVLGDLGEEWVREIRQRTRRGRGQDGGYFKPYSEATGKRGRVTLHDSGDMQRALRVVRLGRKKITIGITDRKQAAKAGYHQRGTRNADGTERMPARPWMELSERQVKRGVEKLIERLNDRERDMI